MVSLGEVVSETRRGPLVVPGSLLGLKRSAKPASSLGSATEIVGSALSSENVTLPSLTDRRTNHSQAHSASLSLVPNPANEFRCDQLASLRM